MKQTTAKAMSLRAKINNYAKEHGILAQVVLQNYMFECLLDRISRSKYVDNFVIKGGILVSSLVGLDVRSTMDMDTTLVHLSLTEEKIKEAVNAIVAVPADDGVVFNFVSVEPIRKDDVYGGFCLRLDAKYESIETPLSIDISTGDAITPEPMNYGYKRLFNSENVIPLRSYPLETVLAEKIETIITRGISGTSRNKSNHGSRNKQSPCCYRKQFGIAIAMGKVPEEISVCKRHNISRNCKCCKRGNS